MSKFLRVRSTHALSFVIMLIALLCQPLSLVAQSSPDFDGNGTVDVSDFLFFVDLFGSKEGEERYDAQYDLDGNGEIGIGDFLIFVDSFGKAANSVPIFTSEPPVTRSVDENTPSGQPIGEPISATDGDDDTLTYRLSGADANSFAIDASTGQISTQGTYDFEQKSSYSVTVIVSDGEGGEASLVVNITINDIEEPSATVPSNVVVEDGDSKLTVRWDAVLDEEGKPSVTGYEVGHRERPDPFDPPGENSDEWVGIQQTNNRLDTNVTITGLLNGQAYLVSVRTLVDGGMSAWSSSVLGIPVIPAVGPIFPGGGGGTSTPRIPPTPPTPPTPPPNNGLGSGASETEQQTAVFVTGPEEGSEEEPVIAQQQQGTNTTDTVSDDINTTGTINVGDSWIDRTPVVGTIDYQDDVDWYRTRLEAAHCYQIDIRGKDSWEYYQSHPDHAPNVELTLSDPFLGGIYSVPGEYIPRTDADYGGVGHDVVKTVRFSSGGTYYIAVTRTKLGNDGTYDLSLIDLGTVTRTCTEISIEGFEGYIKNTISEPDGEDFPDDTTTRGYVAVDGDPATGYKSVGDFDYFKVELIAGNSYRIELKGASSGNGTLLDPIVVLRGSDGAILYGTSPVTQTDEESIVQPTIINDNSGVGMDARLEIDVHITGTYIIEAGDVHFASVGTYTLTVTQTN